MKSYWLFFGDDGLNPTSSFGDSVIKSNQWSAEPADTFAVDSGSACPRVGTSSSVLAGEVSAGRR